MHMTNRVTNLSGLLRALPRKAIDSSAGRPFGTPSGCILDLYAFQLWARRSGHEDLNWGEWLSPAVQEKHVGLRPEVAQK
jgi:hypothetical protein